MHKILQNINLKTILTVILVFLLGWQLGHKDVEFKWTKYRPIVTITDKVQPKEIKLDFKLFWDTWDLISQTYLDKKSIDQSKLFYGAISGMVSSLGDPYTVFLPPQQQKISQEELNGSFEGIGIQLGFNKDKRLAVIAPLEGTPAQKAGIKPLDLIVKIEGKDTTNMSLPDAVNLIRGPKDTKVALTIFRDGESNTRDFSITRDNIIIKSVESYYKETKSGKKVAIIKLSRFGERTNDEWNQAVSELISASSAAVVLDLRNNPGGFLESAVFIASEFLDGGDVVLQEDSEGVRKHFKVDRVGKLLNMPMVALINKGSASASEIVAGALQDRDRVKLVGEKSFGKGTIQEAENLAGGTGIHITVARWLTPKGRWVNDTQGLEPDVKIDMDNEDLTTDRQLEKALELLE